MARYIVQRPLTAGHQWFIRFSDRISRLRAPLNAVLPAASDPVAGRRDQIATLEVRKVVAKSGWELETLTVVQNTLRLAIAGRGIVVEVNPSSNLLIGDLLDLRHHPILRLRPIEPTEDAPPAVPIAIGSDDPITFCTSLLEEYALLQEAARAAGYTQPVMHEWLEGIRRTSMGARVTVKWPRDPCAAICCVTWKATCYARASDSVVTAPPRSGSGTRARGGPFIDS